jgi:hypothetical protein
MKLKLHRNPDRAKIKARFDTQILENEMFKSKFSVELRNRFEVLEVKENINKDCKQVEKVHTETAEKVLDRVKKKNKKTPGKQKTSMKSEKVKGKLRLEYMLRDREVKHRAREEKRVWLEQIGSEAEKSAGKGRSRELYQAGTGKSQTRSTDKLQQ